MTSDPIRPLAARPVERPWGGGGVPSLGLAAIDGKPTGEYWLPTADFPLLVKIIDAREPLSIQLHPDDRVARELGLERGKSECWYVLAAAPSARIWLGLRAGVAAADFLDRAERGEDVSPLLDEVQVAAGQMYFVPPGTVHAIGAGCVLLEVQQDADVTFRVFDWNRKPARTLHLAQARRAIGSDGRAGLQAPRPLPFAVGAGREELVAAEHFAVERIAGSGPGELPSADSAEVFFVERGEGSMVARNVVLECSAGSFVLRPKGAPLRLAPRGDWSVIRMRVP